MPNDWCGNPIEIGSIVVYPTTSGCSPVMKEGVIKVLEQQSRETWVWEGAQNSRERVSKTVYWWKIGILRCETTSRWNDSVWDSTAHGFVAPSRVSYPMTQNITVVPPRPHVE